MCKKSKKSIERRDFIKTLATLSVAGTMNPIEALIRGMSNSVFREAVAGTGTEPKSYVFLGFDGGPNRRVWDQMLTPYQNGISVPTQSSNVYRNNSARYETTPISISGKTINAPVLWSADSPRGVLSQLMENMIVVQGIRLIGDSHANGFRSNLNPTPGGYTVNGMVASQSSTPIAAVNMGGMDVFRSPTGVGIKNIPLLSNAESEYNQYYPKENIVGNLLDPLNSRSSANEAPGSRDRLSSEFITRKEAMKAVMDRSIAALKETANTYKVGSGITNDLARKANSELSVNLYPLLEDYSNTLQKYLNLQTQATLAAKQGKIPGITSDGIYPSSAERNGLPNREDGGYDLRNLIQNDSYIMGVAEGLAVAEVLIRNGKSATISCQSNSNMINNTGMTDPSNGRRYHIGADAHGTGLGAELVASSYAFYITSVLLLEFKNAMKAKNLWSEVVVHVGGDFARSARPDLGGSDHGWQASTMSLFSGAINGFKCFGNLLSNHNIFDPRDTSHPGLWGSGGLIPGLDSSTGHVAQIGNFASTLCTLLGVPSPADNFHSLISYSASSGVKALIEETKITDKA